MSDEQESEDMWGDSSTAETVGTAQPSFIKTHQTIIVSSLVLLVLSGAAVTLLLQGLQKPVAPATVAKEAPRSKNMSSCLLYTSPSPRDRTRSRMPSSA